MMYLICQMIFCLLLAALLGFLIGWFLCRCCCKKDGAQTVVAPSAPSEYKIEEIEGIGKVFGGKLRKEGVDTTLALLNYCTSQSKIDELSQKTGLASRAITGWKSMADLLRVPGLEKQFSEVIFTVGITSVGELATQNASTLLSRMKEENEKVTITTEEFPEVGVVSSWINAAKKLS